MSKLSEILSLTNFSDIDIEINNNILPFHSAILSRSVLLRNIILESKIFNSNKLINFSYEDNSNSDLLINTIKSLYGIYPIININTYFDYMKYASYFIIPELSKLCAQFISNYVNDATVFELMNLLVQYDLSFYLYHRCFSYLLQRLYKLKDNVIVEVTSSGSSSKWSLSSIILTKLINSEALWLSKEEDRKELAKNFDIVLEQENKNKIVIYYNIDVQFKNTEVQDIYIGEKHKLNIYKEANGYLFFIFVYTGSDYNLKKFNYSIIIPSFNPKDLSTYIKLNTEIINSTSNNMLMKQYIVNINKFISHKTILKDDDGDYLPVIIQIEELFEID